MFGGSDPEVLVVGAGPAGLLAALSLAREGVRVRIIDEEDGPATRSYALALHPASLEIAHDVGIIPELSRQAHRLDKLALFDGAEQKAVVDLGALDTRYPFLAIVPQASFETLLAEALKEEGVAVEWRHRLARIEPGEDSVEVTVDKLEKETMGYAVSHMESVVTGSRKHKVPFVIAADGYHSLVRRQLRIPFASVRPADHFAVFEFETGDPLPAEARLVLDEFTANVLWPMRHGRYRFSFEILDPPEAIDSRDKDRMLVHVGPDPELLQTDSLRRLIQERAPWFEASIDQVIFRVLARFERRLIARFGEGRVWFVGDAAHMTGPVGVQSMNVGLREAQLLSQAVVAALRRDSREELGQYATEQHAEWMQLLGREGVPVPSKDTSPWVAERAGRIVPCLPASGAHLQQLLRQLGLELPAT